MMRRMGAAGGLTPEIYGRRLLTEVLPLHSVQFYENDAFVAEMVGGYFHSALGRGDVCLALATPAHRIAIAQVLTARGTDVARAEREGRLHLLDADESLANVTIEGRPSPAQFRARLGSLVQELAGRGRPVRLYGEMVDLLSRRGAHEAALALEGMWNDLGREHAFTLVCGYALDSFSNENDRATFRRVCESHTHVIPAEGYSGAADDDSRMREVSLLQQRAHALEAAVRQRDEFLSLASHELRTPLAVLQLQAQLLLASLRDGETGELECRAKRITRSTDRVTRMIEGLFDVTAMTHSELVLAEAPVELGAVVREAIDDLEEKLAQTGCAVTLDAAGPVEGVWDRLRLGQVVTNLLGNAMKFAPKRPIEISISSEPERAVLVVRDRGPGVSPRDTSRIFERFERAASSANFPGLGLGLWIAHRIVQAHRGTIAVESELGQGARFVVTLPR